MKNITDIRHHKPIIVITIPPALVENLFKSDGPSAPLDFHDSVIFQKISDLKNIVIPTPIKMIDLNISTQTPPLLYYTALM
jgi:hypothetical protein